MGATSPYIATEPIFFGGFRGYQPGDVVPDQVVDDHKLQDSVAREGTKAATAAATATTGQEA